MTSNDLTVAMHLLRERREALERRYADERQALERDVECLLRAEAIVLELTRSRVEPGEGDHGPLPSPSSRSVGHGESDPTQKELVRRASRAFPKGARRWDLIRYIYDIDDKRVAGKTVTTYLRRLRDEGEVTLRGDLWFPTTISEVAPAAR